MQHMGGNIHEFIRDVLIALFLSIAWLVEDETEIRIGSKRLFGDITATNGSISILLEIETEPRRVNSDLAKATEFDCLWIVTPNKKISTAVRRHLRDLQVTERKPWLSVFTLPEAIKAAKELNAGFLSNSFADRLFPLVSTLRGGGDR